MGPPWPPTDPSARRLVSPYAQRPTWRRARARRSPDRNSACSQLLRTTWTICWTAWLSGHGSIGSPSTMRRARVSDTDAMCGPGTTPDFPPASPSCSAVTGLGRLEVNGPRQWSLASRPSRRPRRRLRAWSYIRRPGGRLRTFPVAADADRSHLSAPATPSCRRLCADGCGWPLRRQVPLSGSYDVWGRWVPVSGGREAAQGEHAPIPEMTASAMAVVERFSRMTAPTSWSTGRPARRVPRWLPREVCDGRRLNWRCTSAVAPCDRDCGSARRTL